MVSHVPVTTGSRLFYSHLSTPPIIYGSTVLVVGVIIFEPIINGISKFVDIAPFVRGPIAIPVYPGDTH